MLAKKLRIKEGLTIVALNAPKNYKETLGKLPEGVVIKNRLAAKNDFINLFIKNKAELEQQLFKVADVLSPSGLLWISYPQGTSGTQTDLTLDNGWECSKKIPMQWLSLISFDNDWSAFLMRNEPAKDKVKPQKCTAIYRYNMWMPKQKQ